MSYGTPIYNKEWRALEMVSKWVNIKVTYHQMENNNVDSFERVKGRVGKWNYILVNYYICDMGNSE